MSYDFKAKGSADFKAGKKDERLFHNPEDHGRLYREGWHGARRAAAEQLPPTFPGDPLSAHRDGVAASQQASSSPELPRFNGADYVPDRDHGRLSSQFLRIFDLMKDGKPRTLSEIEEATGDPAASISAQLRHMRKPRFGGHIVERQYLDGGLYSYRLRAGATDADPGRGTFTITAGGKTSEPIHFKAKPDVVAAALEQLTASDRCPNDTDGDGDCHLCYRKGGCPNLRKPDPAPAPEKPLADPPGVPGAGEDGQLDLFG